MNNINVFAYLCLNLLKTCNKMQLETPKESNLCLPFLRAAQQKLLAVFFASFTLTITLCDAYRVKQFCFEIFSGERTASLRLYFQSQKINFCLLALKV